MAPTVHHGAVSAIAGSPGARLALTVWGGGAAASWRGVSPVLAAEQQQLPSQALEHICCPLLAHGAEVGGTRRGSSACAGCGQRADGNHTQRAGRQPARSPGTQHVPYRWHQGHPM